MTEKATTKIIQRTALLLQPEPTSEPLDPFSSKIGGAFAWPAAEPWPWTGPPGKRSSRPWTSVIQLGKADYPLLDFPPGTDLLQLFWLPDYQRGRFEARAFWRSARDVGQIATGQLENTE